MNRILSFLTLLSVAAMTTSCLTSYSIDGTSEVSSLDSKMIRLSVIKNNEFKDIDSAEVVHGKFMFDGTTDSVCLAIMEMEMGNALPLILEKGTINVRIGKQGIFFGGTPSNDLMYGFVSKQDSLFQCISDLDHQYNLAFMDGEDMYEVIPRLQRSNKMIMASLDSLYTISVTENFDNILGPSFFFVATQRYQYPQMDPWVVSIMSKASESFKNNPIVRNYVDAANRIQNELNGLNTPASLSTIDNSTVEDEPKAPTPNEMAAPAKTPDKNSTQQDTSLVNKGKE